MLANFLSKSKPINFIVLFSLFFCLFIVFAINIVFKTKFEFSLLLKLAGFLTLFLVIFFFFNFVVSKNNLTFDNSYAYFMFTILTTYFLSVLFDFKILIILLIQLLFLRKIYSLKSTKNILQKLFDSGFWLGILFILEPFTALFGFLIYTGVFLHQKPIINTLIAPIVGFSAPLILFFTYCFWIDESYQFLNLFYFDSFKSINFFNEGNFYGVTIFILGLAGIGIVLKSPKALSVNNSFKRSWLLLIANLSIAIAFNLLIPNKNGTELLFLLFPAAVLSANGFEMIKKKLFKNIFFLVLIISFLVVPFYL